MKTLKRKDGWWITGVTESEDCGPYSSKKEAEEDRVGLARTEKNMDKRPFWTCEKSEPLTLVILRQSKKLELFALFPEEAVDGDTERCKCYGLSNGYSSVDYTKCMRVSKAATPKESEKILAALGKLKWKNLKVIKRATSIMHTKRRKKQ
jgi:hypothetical protein